MRFRSIVYISRCDFEQAVSDLYHFSTSVPAKQYAGCVHDTGGAFDVDGAACLASLGSRSMSEQQTASCGNASCFAPNKNKVADTKVSDVSACVRLASWLQLKVGVTSAAEARRSART